MASASELEGAEAIGLLEELGNAGYISLKLEQFGFNADAGLVGVTLLYKGRAVIGQRLDPNEELLEILEAIAAAIEGLEDVDAEQKGKAQKALEKLKTFGRGISATAAVKIIEMVAHALSDDR